MKRIVGIIFSLAPVLCHAQKSKTLNTGVLVKPGEEIAFSFPIKHSAKTVVVCRELHDKYIVYRFGSPNKVDLQYPAAPDTNSWKLFKYRGYTRGGGKANLARGEYSLEFVNNGVQYKIHEDWSSEDDSFDISIDIEGKDFSKSLEGDPKYRQGDMGYFVGDDAVLHNYMYDE